jgi:C_GCAxxG_C_C family probable redox protein
MKDERMSDKSVSKVELAVAAHREGFNCSQAVLSAFAPDLGLDREVALRVSSVFGAGIGRTGQTCGAVSGALMAIGLKYGSINPEDKTTKERVYALGREFVRQFRARNGTTLCPELLGYDVGTPEGLQAVREKGLVATVCTPAVQDAAEILERLLQGNSVGHLV